LISNFLPRRENLKDSGRLENFFQPPAKVGMVQKSVLSNGVRVLTEAMPQMVSATIGIWVENGSRYEERHENGVSHFIEHLLFKGTKKRTAAQIAEEIDAVGGVVVDSSLAEARDLVKSERFSKVTILYDDDGALASRLARLCGGHQVHIGPRYVAELKRRSPGLGIH
jgi:hypothetical protein